MVSSGRTAAVAVIVVLASACVGTARTVATLATIPPPTSAPTSTTSPSLTAAASAVVVRYYSALAAHNYPAAAACLSPAIRNSMTTGLGSDFTNLVTLTGLRVDTSGEYGPGGVVNPTPRDPVGVQVVVSYEAVYRRVITSDDGEQTVFVSVQRSAAGPWQIVAIASGP